MVDETVMKEQFPKQIHASIEANQSTINSPWLYSLNLYLLLALR